MRCGITALAKPERSLEHISLSSVFIPFFTPSVRVELLNSQVVVFSSVERQRNQGHSFMKILPPAFLVVINLALNLAGA